MVFDLDGTLVDSVPGIAACLRAAFADVVPGLEIPDPAPFVGPPVARMIPALAPDLAPAVHAAVLARFRLRYDGDGWRVVDPMPGARAALVALTEAGVRCFVATYKPERPTRAILAALALLPLVEDLRCVDGPGGPAPTKAAMLRDLLDRAALVPARTWYVGDTPGDAEAAAEAGLRFAGVGPAPFPPGAERYPDLDAWIAAFDLPAAVTTRS